MDGHLGTTNIFLGIIAAVSLLEGLLVIGVGIAAFAMYRRVMDLVNGIEARQIAPAMTRVNAILDDVKQVSAKVKEETERVDRAIRTTMDRVDATAGRVRSTVRAKASWIVGVMRAVRVAIEGVLQSDSRPEPPPAYR